jgi:NAD(P)-dependent dehydrogenase (short-subunit alcohol dehydrogenase family)
VTLDGRTALVTGAGRGVGQALALELADAGVATVLVTRTEDELAETARLVKQHGGTAVVVEADLSAPGAVAEVVGRARRRAGSTC